MIGAHAGLPRGNSFRLPFFLCSLLRFSYLLLLDDAAVYIPSIPAQFIFLLTFILLGICMYMLQYAAYLCTMLVSKVFPFFVSWYIRMLMMLLSTTTFEFSCSLRGCNFHFPLCFVVRTYLRMLMMLSTTLSYRICTYFLFVVALF